MVYVFYGLNSFLINKEIDKLKEGVSNNNFFRFDLENTSLYEILMHADEGSLFGGKKVILVENSYIFTGTTNKKLTTYDLKSLEDYFNNPANDTILIFSIIKDKLDERKKVVKIAKEKGYLKEYNKINNPEALIEDMFKPYKISKTDITLFMNRLNNNLAVIEQEINKIKLYKDDDLNITHEDIINLTNSNIDTDIFNLIENIITSNKKEAINSYHEMLELGEEPIMILVMLSNQFRMLYQVKKLYKYGYSEKDISKELKVHWYPVRKCLEKMYNYDDNILLKYLYDLSNLDIDIKTGKVDKELGLEMFILNI